MRVIGRAMVITTLLASAFPVWGQPMSQGVPPTGVRIRLYDYARLPPSRLDWAKQVALHLLEGAGVRTVWLDCRLSQDEPVRDAECATPRTPLDLQLQILPETMTMRIQTDRHSLGHALITPGTSYFAAAYFQRATDLAGRRIADRYDILGSILAHEIGHLLLQGSVHSRKGLMRSDWRDADLKQIACGELRFSRRQARHMVAAVRVRAQMASQHLAESEMPVSNTLASSGL